jgi:hypothetical protein
MNNGLCGYAHLAAALKPTAPELSSGRNDGRRVEDLPLRAATYSIVMASTAVKSCTPNASCLRVMGEKTLDLISASAVWMSTLAPYNLTRFTTVFDLSFPNATSYLGGVKPNYFRVSCSTYTRYKRKNHTKNRMIGCQGEHDF